MKTVGGKLAIVTPNFYEQIVGGSEYQSYLLARAAKMAGIEVHHIFTNLDVDKLIPNKLGINLHPVFPPRYKKYIRGLGKTDFLCLPQYWSKINKIRPDCVYCRSGVVQAGMAAYYAKKNICKSVWHVASSVDVIPSPLLPMLRRPLNLIENKSIEYAIHHSTHVVAHANFQADLLMKYYGRKAVVILKEQPEPLESLDKCELFTVAWVANIKPLKQPEMFIRLAREFVQSKEMRFVMIGRPAKGRYQDELDSKIEGLPNLSYLREQPIDEVNRILARSHVFVNTSTYEGLPNTFVQSWMREVPVVSMLLDPDNIIQREKVGFFSGGFDQMVKDLQILFENPALREEMGKKARKYSIEHHSLEKNMGRLLMLIQ